MDAVKFIDKAVFLDELEYIRSVYNHKYVHGEMSSLLRQKIEDIEWFIDLVKKYPSVKGSCESVSSYD